MAYKDPNYQKNYRAAHPHKVREWGAAYYAADPTKFRTRSKAWKDANRDHLHEYDRARRGTLKGRFYTLNIKARNRNIVVDLNFEEYVGLIDGKNCFYCKGPLNPTGGGLDRKNSLLGYAKNNCVPCCADCNMIRGKDRISHSEMIEVAALLNRLRNTT